LDSHNYVHIAHPCWWVDSAGNHPDPYTVISVDDVKNGKWRAINPSLNAYSLKYVETLQTNGRYMLIIWPYHCLIATEGHNVMPNVMKSLLEWEEKFRVVNKITKGSNLYTEHYSALKADVPNDEDNTTMMNEKLVTMLQKDDNDILIAGEALSHCVANTIRDIANEFSDEQVKRFVLLEDACSNVENYEYLGEEFVKDMVAKGMRVAKTTDYFA